MTKFSAARRSQSIIDHFLAILGTRPAKSDSLSPSAQEYAEIIRGPSLVFPMFGAPEISVSVGWFVPWR